MKKLIALFVVCTASVFGYSLRTGTYMLSGDNTKWDGKAYQGEVTITPQGENYRVVWKVGSYGQQTQTGVGIVYNDTFSVAFVDNATGAWGVAIYKVRDGELEGRWTSATSTVQKPEFLVWKGY